MEPEPNLDPEADLSSETFSVTLDQFNGPLDLLLYLVRRQELDIMDIPVAKITDQYLKYIEVLTVLDIDAVGDFIVLASKLIEIKSFEALPNEQEVEEEIEDPRKELVTRLLAYKKFCEEAGQLEKRGRLWQRRYPRLAVDLKPKERNAAEEPIQEIVVWDLVSAFGRILRERAPAAK
ncbi:MAG: segregation/condensation protein A, partial [Thermoguttaceae bacterium]|nr:segregation/condensation protein A [Thermoguttaceae bacterium]